MSKPFARAIAMMATIAAHLRAGMETYQAHAAVGPYKSRGKGQGRTNGSSNTMARDKRAAVKRRNQQRHRLAVSRSGT
jgi:hypothetical protein